MGGGGELRLMTRFATSYHVEFWYLLDGMMDDVFFSSHRAECIVGGTQIHHMNKKSLFKVREGLN